MTTPARQMTRRRRLILRVTTRRDVEMGLPISLEIAAALRSELGDRLDALMAANGTTPPPGAVA